MITKSSVLAGCLFFRGATSSCFLRNARVGAKAACPRASVGVVAVVVVGGGGSGTGGQGSGEQDVECHSERRRQLVHVDGKCGN